MSISSNRGSAEHQLENDEDRSRLRVAKACSRCRARKDRCDGLKPSCSACINANKQCVYETTTKKRGLPEGYVRGLEKLLTLASNCVEGLENVFIGYLQNEEVKKEWNSAVGDELYANWKDSKLYQELETFLQINGASSAGTKRKRGVDCDVPEGPGDRLDMIMQSLRGRQQCISASQRSPSASATNNDVGNGAKDQEALPSDSEVFPSNSKELLDTYFTYVHCWFPVVDRPSVLKNFYNHLRRTPTPQKTPDGSKALIWSIFSYAVAIDPMCSDRKDLARRYSEIALKYLPTPYTNDADVQDFDVMHGQALLVLSLLRLGNGQWLGSWNCTGRAARILSALQRDNELRNDLFGAFQGCFIVETLLNVHFHNSHSLFPASLMRTMVNEDGHEEWETWAPAQRHVASAEPSLALSIFNRLTKIFLVVHEAISETSAGSDPVYIQSKLEEVHNLAQEHFAAGLASPSVHSPPHHVFFQIGLLFAQLRLVSCVSEMARQQFDLASLATNVLGLFEICEKSHIGLARVPPLYADILILASDVAANAQYAFGLSAGSPSYRDFSSAVTNFRVRLSSIWASFKKQDEDFEDISALQAEERQISQVYTINPSPPLTSTPGQPLVMNASIAGSSASQRRNSVSSPAYTSAASGSFSQHNWPGFSPAAMGGNTTFGVGFPVTSPGFPQGDEVDAIFHEMAHLDTNEWTNERALGLKDFGFSDESAFLDFCNDPGRLAVPVDSASQAPLSSNMLSWTFGPHGPEEA